MKKVEIIHTDKDIETELTAVYGFVLMFCKVLQKYK